MFVACGRLPRDLLELETRFSTEAADEFTFRFNRRKSRSSGKLFYPLLKQAVAVEPRSLQIAGQMLHKPEFLKPQPIGVTCVT